MDGFITRGPVRIGNLRREAAFLGILPDRIIFATHIPPEFHLARLPLADLFLDTLPYNSHTTQRCTLGGSTGPDLSWRNLCGQGRGQSLKCDRPTRVGDEIIGGI